MKKYYYPICLFMLTSLFLMSCSSVEESVYEENVDKICPDIEQLLFDASASTTFDLKVANNVLVWDAVVNTDWCVMEKGSKNLIITAKQNTTNASRTATISLFQNDVIKQTITVEQKPVADGVMTSDKVIWDDAHWRLYGLKGRVKSLEQSSMPTLIEFNLDGKQVFWGDKDRVNDYIVSEYYADGRIKKQTHYKNGGTVSSTKVFTYGTHTKYIPSIADFWGPTNEIMYLVQGLEKMEMTKDDGTTLKREVKVSGNNVTIDDTFSTYTYTSSGDLPSSIVVNPKSNSQTLTLTYKYASNGMPLQFIYSELDKVTNLDFETTSSFILHKKYERSELDEYTQTYDYGANGNILLETTTYKEYGFPIEVLKHYSGYEFDAQGNWKKRINGAETLENRTIIYFE